MFVLFSVCICVCALTLLLILQQIDNQGNITPDPAANYKLYDRVVNVSSHNAASFSLIKTITDILECGCGLLFEKNE